MENRSLLIEWKGDCILRPVSLRRWASGSRVIYCHPLDCVPMYVLFILSVRVVLCLGGLQMEVGEGVDRWGWIKWTWRVKGQKVAQIPFQFICICVGAWVVYMMSVEHLGDIPPVKRDSHTELLSALTTMRWMGPTRVTDLILRPLLSASRELLRVNGVGKLWCPGDLVRHCSVWMLRRSRAVLIRLDVKGESLFPVFNIPPVWSFRFPLYVVNRLW
jgi:hypothetical protein